MRKSPVRRPRLIILLATSAAGAIIAATLIVQNRDADPDRSLADDLGTISAGDHAEAVATASPEATRAAFEVLDEDGTAADAAVAAAAVLSVVEPHYSNLLGGETSIVYYEAEENRARSIEGVGYVGERFTMEDYQQQGGAEPAGLHQALVPGAWDGWIGLLRDYGELDLPRLLAPAIDLARDGHQVSADLETAVATADETGLFNEEGQAVFAPGGDLVARGDQVRQPDLADTLDELSGVWDDEEGGRAEALERSRDHFYDGPLGARVVEAVTAAGGYLTVDDLRRFEARDLDPVTLDYRDGLTVVQNPPVSQGLTMLAALNTLRDAGLAELDADDPTAVGLQIEAMSLALADREAHVGDPAYTETPVDELLSADYGARQLDRIDLDTPSSWPIPSELPSRDTTTFQIADSDGNVAAVTTSIGFQLTIAGDTGITMNNRMRFMTSVDPASPNFLEPGKRVRYTGNPYLVLRDGRPYLAGGSIGADIQAQLQTQQLLAIVEWGMSPHEAVNRWRWESTAAPSSSYPFTAQNTLVVEDTIPADTRDALADRGYPIADPESDSALGHAGIIEFSPDGRTARLGLDERREESSGHVRDVEEGDTDR